MVLFVLVMIIMVLFLYGLRIWLLYSRKSHPNAELLISELEKICH